MASPIPPFYCFGASDGNDPVCIGKAGVVTVVLGGIVLLWLFWDWAATVRFNRKYNMPVRVPGLPIVGNTLQLPLQHQGPVAAELAKKYGEMFTMKIGGLDWVFLNSSRVVTALLERRSAIYCSRPPFPMTQEIMSRNGRMVLMPHSDLWRSQRKQMHQILSTRQLEAFRFARNMESKHLLYEYLHKPESWYAANGRYSNSVIMSIVFGRRSDLNNPQLRDVQMTMEMFITSVQPGANIVDWRVRGNRMFEETKRVYARELDSLKEKIAAGTQKPCFASDLVETKEVKTWGEVPTLFMLGTLMEAAAVAYPDWVARARKELDAVCGHNAERLSGFDDRSQLPYITPVIKEIFRWRPVLTEIFEGYRFPAGTVFVWNAWSIALDEREYKQPELFMPEQFLNEDLEKPLKGHWCFGAGRRVRVGWQVGDSNGHPVDTMNIPQMDWKNPPFKVDIKPRSQKHAELVERKGYKPVHTMY
ncbi:cytochrome P450 [Delitschia confertaspora ATCC 74209]|uniref:Cytochrome P450 n=1 Tax=Delitschia confertaspora ATCC 74209 TaxID=1513339 RepID=A0A9P4JL45_9PLEO|nr:cytochrome P450 [Delitschia confertaspora ATCC 74209]